MFVSDPLLLLSPYCSIGRQNAGTEVGRKRRTQTRTTPTTIQNPGIRARPREPGIKSHKTRRGCPGKIEAAFDRHLGPETRTASHQLNREPGQLKVIFPGAFAVYAPAAMALNKQPQAGISILIAIPARAQTIEDGRCTKRCQITVA